MHRQVLRTALAIALVATLGACIEVPMPAPKDALAVKDLKVSEGVGLETACTPTGVEICFDAKDNNCNGVIDEGCGLHTGILQFAIAWDAPDADVDLRVYDPSGDMAEVNKVTSAGLQQDRDCPHPGGARGEDCNGQNVENVYLTEGDPQHGKYKVLVHLDKIGSAKPPVRVRLSARVGQRSFTMVMDLAPGTGTEDKVFEFSL